jgi:hypothetical protein
MLSGRGHVKIKKEHAECGCICMFSMIVKNKIKKLSSIPYIENLS